MYIEISYKVIYIVVAINNNGNIVKYFLNPSKLNIFSIEIVINDKFKKNRISFKHLIKKVHIWEVYVRYLIYIN